MLALAGSAALMGCATKDPLAWRIEPVYQSGQSSNQAIGRGYTAIARQYEGEGRWEQAAVCFRLMKPQGGLPRT